MCLPVENSAQHDSFKLFLVCPCALGRKGFIEFDWILKSFPVSLHLSFLSSVPSSPLHFPSGIKAKQAIHYLIQT